jgi:glycosyltransferase involved in cell wall biosynthesis
LDLVIVGDGPERGVLEREAARLGLGDTAVRFLGRRADVPALLRQADFLVSSSDHEGFPNVLLEAMAARLPAIATEAGDVASILLPGVTGYVVPTDDVAQLADRMVALARAAGTRRAMGQAARKRVELMYRDSTLADKMLAAYQSAAARRSGRRRRRAFPLMASGEARARISAR